MVPPTPSLGGGAVPPPRLRRLWLRVVKTPPRAECDDDKPLIGDNLLLLSASQRDSAQRAIKKYYSLLRAVIRKPVAAR